MTSSIRPTDLEDEHADSPTVYDLEPAEAPARRQPGSRVLCQLDGYDDVEVQVTNRERIAYEKTAVRHKEWPTPEGGRSFVMTFVTFAAAKRAGHPAATTFDAWQDVLLDWDEVNEPADPTR